jgi:tRNA(Arg) A34 adenosine deaminase TadA
MTIFVKLYRGGGGRKGMSQKLDHIADDLLSFFVSSPHWAKQNVQWHAAALLDGRRIVCKGLNQQLEFCSHGTTPPNYVSCHAELNVMYQMSKRLRNSTSCLKRYTLLVVRIKKIDKQLGNSKPCSDCIEVMKQFGIKKVCYSLGDGSLVVERLNRMHNNRSSGNHRLHSGDFVPRKQRKI